MALKNNQAKAHFSYKKDDVDLVEVGQFLRETTKYRVEREWYIFIAKTNGEYGGFSSTVGEKAHISYKIKNPDLILIDKHSQTLKLVIEIDGSVHDRKFLKTEQRNEVYFMAGIPLLVIDKADIETTIFDLVHKKVEEFEQNNQ
jgi:hypothetical protein